MENTTNNLERAHKNYGSQVLGNGRKIWLIHPVPYTFEHIVVHLHMRGIELESAPILHV